MLDARSPTIVATAPAVKISDVAMSSGVTEPAVNRIDNPRVANALAMLPRSDTRPPESIDRKRQHKTSNVAARPRRHVKPEMLLAARHGNLFDPRQAAEPIQFADRQNAEVPRYSLSLGHGGRQTASPKSTHIALTMSLVSGGNTLMCASSRPTRERSLRLVKSLLLRIVRLLS